MALKPREQLERSILKHLRFHARSGVWLKADDETSLKLGAPSRAMLASCIMTMFRRNLFRIIPVPGSGENILNPVGALRESPPSDWMDSAAAMFSSGVSVMVTSDGIKRHEELKRSTTEIRKAIWKRREVDDGAQWTGKVQEQ